MKLPIPWQRNAAAKQGLAHVGDAIGRCRAGAGAPVNLYADLWASVVLRLSAPDFLAGQQNALVLGAPASGRQAVLLRLADSINACFTEARHAAFHVELGGLVSTSTVYTWTSVDEVYRGLMAAPLKWPQKGLALKPDRELQRLETQLAALLEVPIARLDTLAVRNTFYAWMDRLTIQTLAFIVDDLSALAPEFIPVLLQLLLDTFPRGGRVALKLGGTKEALKVEGRAKRPAAGAPAGLPLGMQLSHDLLVALDLDQLLRAPDLAPSATDPRQAFLLARLEKANPALLARVQGSGPAQDNVPQPEWGNLFEPAEAWFAPFKAGNFDVNLIGAALEVLAADLAKKPEAKATTAMVEQAIARIKDPAGLHSGSRTSPREPPRESSRHSDEVDAAQEDG
jgi:hypothetical protein